MNAVGRGGRSRRQILSPTLLAFVWVALAATQAFAQGAESSSSSRSPLGGLGGTLLIWWICARRTYKEIGGWLLLFYIQVYGGALVTLIVALVSFNNYQPATWVGAPTLYPLFLLSAVPGIALRLGELFVAEKARRARSWKFVRTLRTLLWFDIGAAVVGTLIDASYFENDLPLSILALVWPCVWLPYFYLSKRVRRVFEIRDWPEDTSREPAKAVRAAGVNDDETPTAPIRGNPMQCATCGAAIPLTARFCSSCGQQVSDAADAKSPAEVNVAWLTSVLQAQSYDVNAQEGTASGLVARHQSRPNLFLELRSDARVITLQAIYSIKKPGWMQKADFLAALNKANGTDWFCTCYAPDSLDKLLVSSFIYLTERLSARDIAAFLEMFSAGAQRAIERSGMAKFG